MGVPGSGVIGIGVAILLSDSALDSDPQLLSCRLS